MNVFFFSFVKYIINFYYMLEKLNYEANFVWLRIFGPLYYTQYNSPCAIFFLGKHESLDTIESALTFVKHYNIKEYDR